MQFAIDPISGDRIQADPDLIAICPLCGAKCVPKCGEIKLWHWAHQSRNDCDVWSEGETDWHRWWKSLVIPSAQEVVMPPHRADVVGNRGVVLEFQRSPISTYEIRERELFYKNMIWVFDGSDFRKHISCRRKTSEDGSEFITFRWKWPRLSLTAVTKPLFIDLGDTRFGIEDAILQIRKISHSKSCGGWGRICGAQEFIRQHLWDVLTDEYRGVI